MKVDLFFSRDISEPHAEIHTNELTDNIHQAIALLEDDSKMDMLAVKKGKDISFLDFDEIFMIRVEDKQVIVYTQEDKYSIKKALYQVEESLNPSFVRILIEFFSHLRFSRLANFISSISSKRY